MKNFLKHLLPSKEAIFNQEAIMEELPIIAKHLYPKEVMKIHHEFETAADKLLEEAKSIIQEAATKDVDKVSRLEKLGFKQVNQVIQLKPLLQKAELSKKQLELLKYYRQEYPFNKFITEEQVKIICRKYNLVCGDVNRFKGFVPEKNLKQVESFKLKNQDSLIIYEYCYGSGWGLVSDWMKKFPEHTLDYFMRYKGNTDKLREIEISLQICAPVKDMDISGLELKEGYKLEKKHIPDPVVLQPVKGGYLILTAWGDEASDPLVVNEINN